MTSAENLRSLLGEEIPADGSEDDTLFTEAQISDLLSQAGGNVDKAAYEGWRIKMAKFANLVDTVEGSSKRNLGSLYGQAKDQVKYFGEVVGASDFDVRGRTRIGKIKRDGFN